MAAFISAAGTVDLPGFLRQLIHADKDLFQLAVIRDIIAAFPGPVGISPEIILKIQVLKLLIIIL